MCIRDSFNDAHRAESMPYFGQEILLQAQAKGGLDAPAYRKALATCRQQSRVRGIDLALRTHRLDALIAPTGGPAWLIDLVNGDHFGGGSSQLAAVAGYPTITVPAGRIFGLPTVPASRCRVKWHGGSPRPQNSPPPVSARSR